MPVAMQTPSDFSDFPWMQTAFEELGVRELPGKSHNKRIIEYHAAAGGAKDEEVAWCSAFVNWVMRQNGVKGTGRANARSWTSWGTTLTTPVFGCIAVLTRPPKAYHGHVAFYTGETAGKLVLLGGNQDNAVCLKDYARNRLITYRWPAGAAVPSSSSTPAPYLVSGS